MVIRNDAQRRRPIESAQPTFNPAARADAQAPAADARDTESPLAASGAIAARARDTDVAVRDGAPADSARVRSEVKEGSASRDGRRDFRGIGVDGESPEMTVSTIGGRTVVDAGDGNDNIRVENKAGGGVTVTVNGESRDFSDAQARNMTIRGGRGHDHIRVHNDVGYDLTLEGQDGNDRIRGGAGNDTIRGGAGNDRMFGSRGDDAMEGGAGDDRMLGGSGNDYMNGGQGDDHMRGGSGNDVMYGLSGADRMIGDSGNDYLDGGRDNDHISGRGGDDQVVGGRGNDRLSGGAGADVMAGGHGTDRFHGGRGADRSFHESGEVRDRMEGGQEVDMSAADPGTSIAVNGDAAFQERVESDLDALRSVPQGRGLMADMDRTGRQTRIQQTNGGNATGYPNPSDRMMTSNNTVNGAGTDADIDYNPSRIDIGSDAWDERPPVVGLFHEMVHAENAGQGEMPDGLTDGDKNRERIAVGLPIDEDGDASTPRTQPNRWTENGLRSELGLTNRDRY